MMILPCLYVSETGAMGRGVFTSESIEKGTVIEESPVIVMTNGERKLMDQTILHDYIFEWGEKKNECCMALGYIPTNQIASTKWILKNKPSRSGRYIL